jgi:hypothetical protein
LDEGRRAIALMPLEKDVNNGSFVLQYFAVTAGWAGDKELALQQLETGLRAPAASLMLSYGALKLLPSGTRSAAIRASNKSLLPFPQKRNNSYAGVVATGLWPVSAWHCMSRRDRNGPQGRIYSKGGSPR